MYTYKNSVVKKMATIEIFADRQSNSKLISRQKESAKSARYYRPTNIFYP